MHRADRVYNAGTGLALSRRPDGRAFASRPSTCSPLGEATAPYTARHPEETLLHRVAREHLETFLARARRLDHPVPRFVEREFRAFLDCGILAGGFLRLHCDRCGHDRLVPFSCKGRICPSCAGRRMADTAAHLVDRLSHAASCTL
jgi:hypothetical protein